MSYFSFTNELDGWHTCLLISPVCTLFFSAYIVKLIQFHFKKGSFTIDLLQICAANS